MMNSSLYNPFLEATKNVFQLMLDLTDMKEILPIEFSNQDGLNISIGVIGDLEGEVIYRFSKDTSLSMVTIMCGMEMDSIDDFVTSAISEIANIISGNVLTLLAASEMNCDILPPSVLISKEKEEYTIKEEYWISTKIGTICLEIMLNPIL